MRSGKRRAFVLFVGGAIFAPRALAQTQRMARVVWLTFLNDEIRARIVKALDQRGLVVGKNLSLHFEDSKSQDDDQRMKELVASRPDVIVVHGDPVGLRGFTRQVPIVFYDYAHDPVSVGVAESLRRPGGNVTGTFVPWNDVTSRTWQLLKEFNPSMKVAATISTTEGKEEWEKYKKSHPEGARMFEEDGAAPRRAAEKQLGIKIIDMYVPKDSTRAEIAAAVARERAEALDVGFPGTPEWLAFVKTTRVPTAIFSFAAVRRGRAILGISFDDEIGLQQSAERVARIIGGESPATIPIYMISTFPIALNTGIARAAGINIPASVLLQATEKYG